jgi:hypothetical protein
VCGQHHAPAAFTSGKDSVPIVQAAGWAPEPVCIGAENLFPTEIRSPDLPAHSVVAIPTTLSRLPQILIKLEFYRQIFKIYLNIKFHKIPSVGAELLHADGHTDRHNESNDLFRNFANAPKNVSTVGGLDEALAL